MKILITGGAGFIGSHIADEYVRLGHKVVVVDNLSTGKRKNVNPNAKFYKGDIKNRAFVYDIMKRERPNAVNHQAALASLRKAVKEPEELVDANITGTMNLLLAAGKYPIKKFIFASSCSVFGLPKKLPATETDPVNPLSPYAFTKLADEGMIQFYARWTGFNYVIFRYPNVHGPRQNPEGEAGVVPIFVGLMKQGERPGIFGDGSKTRDYVYVGDVAHANALALRKGKNEIIHLGWKKEVSDQVIFNKIERVMNTGLSPRYLPFRSWEAKRISQNSNKAKRVLGWTPKVKLDEGIRKTVLTI